MSTDPAGPMYQFDDFRLDVANRELWRGDKRLSLTARYFDALVLLVTEHGQLVAKDAFFEQVWGDVVVGDAALTQCIKDIRKELGDDAGNPRYIETVPRFGYRFVAPVALAATESDGRWAPAASVRYLPEPAAMRRAYVEGTAGMIGGGVAGALGGMAYGLALASAPGEAQMGTVSIIMVLTSLAALLGIIGGFGVSFGMAGAGLLGPGSALWRILGAAFGGMLLGGLAKLFGMDAFTLLFGRAPAGITGGLEGAALGAAVALGAHLGGGLDADRPWRPAVGAGLGGLMAGIIIPLAGGHLLGGSLELLARSFASSRLQLDALGRFFGELQFGQTTQVVLGGAEGLVFGSCVVGAVVLARRIWR